MYFASTLPKPHTPEHRPKLCQRACKANAEEKEILKMPHRTTKDNENVATNRLTNHGRQGSTGGNRRLAQWRVKWLIEHSTPHQLLWCIGNFVLRNPPLRQAPKRWRSL